MRQELQISHCGAGLGEDIREDQEDTQYHISMYKHTILNQRGAHISKFQSTSDHSDIQQLNQDFQSSQHILLQIQDHSTLNLLIVHFLEDGRQLIHLGCSVMRLDDASGSQVQSLNSFFSVSHS